MSPFFRRQILNLTMVAGLFLTGCEITDYDLVLDKKRLKDAANEKVRVEKLELSSSKAANPEPIVSNVNQSAIAAEMEAAGVYVGVLSGTNNINELDFTDAVYGNDHLRKIVELPFLKKLVVNGSQSDLETFEVIGQIKNLRHLEIPISPATPEALRNLLGLEKLTFLQIFRSDVTDEGFKVLAQMKSLQQIRCAQTRISDDAIRNIEGLETLTALDLSDCNQITDQALTYLESFKRLKFLKVWGQGISDQGMQSICLLYTSPSPRDS